MRVCVHKNEMMFHLLSIIFFLCLYENIIGVLYDCVDVRWMVGRAYIESGKIFLFDGRCGFFSGEIISIVKDINGFAKPIRELHFPIYYRIDLTLKLNGL